VLRNTFCEGEEVQFMYRIAKASSEFIPDGTTQNDYTFPVCKRLLKDIEICGWLQYEGWKASLYEPDAQSSIGAAVQVTWFLHQSKFLNKSK